MAHKAELAAAHALRRFAVEDGERGEIALAAVHAVGVVAQARLHIFYFLTRHGRVDGDNLHLYLQGHKGDAVLRQVVEIAAHVAGRHLHVFCERLFHLLHAVAVGHVGGVVFAYLGERLAEILLHFLARAEVADKEVHLRVHLLLNHAFGHLHGVEVGLVQEETFDGDVLGDDAIRVAVDALAVLLHFLVGAFDVRFIDGVVAYDPCHFLGDIVLSCGIKRCGAGCCEA